MRVCRAALLVVAVFASMLSHTERASADSLHDSLAQAVNAYRSSHGLPTLVASPTLQAAAQFMADDMAAHGIPDPPHVSSDGRTSLQRMTDAGYPTAIAWSGEILAWGTNAAQGAMTLWINSPSHLALLNDAKWRAAGYGVACWGINACSWVVDFGSVVDATFASSGGAPSAAVIAPPPPTYHAAFYAESAFPVASPGERVTWTIAFTNTGTAGWSDAHLGTSNPLDSYSLLATPSWLSANRPTRQTTPWVGPGQQAWFVVELAAPPQSGTYRLYVRPLIDGLTWLEDSGAYVDLIVR